MHIFVICLLVAFVILTLRIHFFDEPNKRRLFGTREFQIVENEYFREGSIIKVEYFIQEKCKIFGNFKWIDVTETNCGWGDCYEVAVTFETKEEAKQYVNKICKSEVWKGKRQTVVDTHKC